MVQKIEHVEMLSVAQSIVCDRMNFYRSYLHFFCGVKDFSGDWGYWQRDACDDERRVLCQFLSGEPVRRDSNWLEFIVPESRLDGMVMSDEELLDALFFKNPHFMIAEALHGRKISVRVLPETVRCLRSFKGCNRAMGEYRKLKLGFSTIVQLVSPLADISEEELENHFWCRNDYTPESRDEWWRILKAVAANPKGVYCGRAGRFLAKAPVCSRDLDRIFISEMKGSRRTCLHELINLGASFGPNADISNDLAEGLRDYRFDVRGSVCRFLSYHGNLQKKGWCSVGVKLPRTDVRPWLFVNNVLKGIGECSRHVREWVEKGRVGAFEIKEGSFEACVKFNEFPNPRAVQYLMISRRSNFAKSYGGDRQISREELLDEVTREVCGLLRFISAMAHFVEYLLAGSRSVEIMNANLCQHMLDSIKISPLDYIEHPDCIIKNLAFYYMNGES